MMTRFFGILLLSLMSLAACSTPTTTLGPDGKALPRVYRIQSGDTAKIQYRMLDSVNALRAASGASEVKLDASLNAAAATHSLDMHNQNRPWHFGSNGSSPVDRVVQTGYSGLLIGENISETFETEIETLGAWMDVVDTRDIILDTRATDLGIAWYQEKGGKIWWTLILGAQ
jgi:uncharacterized protein YkwD